MSVFLSTTRGIGSMIEGFFDPCLDLTKLSEVFGFNNGCPEVSKVYMCRDGLTKNAPQIKQCFDSCKQDETFFGLIGRLGCFEYCKDLKICGDGE